ncbi:MAG: MerR family transcriptional regulator [Desulfohalobiaceae bacterium]|nr:MerR family transcriptional regulator [Desulfohalobiaceae bacterium]
MTKDTRLNISELARKAGLTNSTCRRYVKTFAEFIPHEGKGRQKLFPSECVQTLKHIKSLYDNGRSTEQVLDVLDRDYERIMDIQTQEDKDQIQAQEVVKTLVEHLRKQDSKDQEINKLKQAVSMLHKQVVDFRHEQKALPDPGSIDQILDRLNRLEERMAALEDKERSWWRKLLPG